MIADMMGFSQGQGDFSAHRNDNNPFITEGASRSFDKLRTDTSSTVATLNGSSDAVEMQTYSTTAKPEEKVEDRKKEDKKKK